LNMLLGLVFASYGAVNTAAGDAVTLVQQMRKAISTAHLTRSFVSLWTIIVQMEDDDYPAHPGTTVTATSLSRAFESENMTWQNAAYLISRTVQWVESETEAPVLDMDDSIRLLGQTKCTALQCLEAAEISKELLEKQVEESSKKGAMELSQTLGGVVGNAVSSVPEEESEVQKPTAELVLASLDNLLVMLGASQKEQRDSVQFLKNRVRSERITAEARDTALKQELTDFKTRLSRARRCILRLGEIFEDMQFGSLAGIPEKMEQQIMLSFGSRPTLASCNAKPGDLVRLEQKVCATLQKIDEISSEGETIADARQMLWNIQHSMSRIQSKLS